MSLRRSKMSAMWVLALAVLLGQNVSSLAAERTFQLGGQSMVLEDVSDQAPVYFRSMRLNRVLNVWNVEATVTNLGGAALNGPLVLLVESFTNTSGLLVADGSADGKTFLDLSAQLGNGALSQGEGSVARTLTLGRSGTGAPSVVAKVFARLAQPVAGLQIVRTLDNAGLPLPSVTVDSPGAPGGAAQTDDAFGLATLTQTNQTRALRFSVAGYLPVWRAANVSTGAVGIIPNPRLTRRDVNPASFTPIGGGELTRGNPAVQVKFTPGAFSQDTAAVLTPLTAQTLPLFLPQGWSPLAAFWLELSAEPALVGNGTLTPSGPIPPSETAAFVRLNTNTPAWEVLQLVNGNGTNTVNVSLPGSGA